MENEKIRLVASFNDASNVFRLDLSETSFKAIERCNFKMYRKTINEYNTLIEKGTQYTKSLMLNFIGDMCAVFNIHNYVKSCKDVLHMHIYEIQEM